MTLRAGAEAAAAAGSALENGLQAARGFSEFSTFEILDGFGNVFKRIMMI